MEKKTSKQKELPFPKKPVPVIIIHNKNFFRWLMSCFMVCGCMFVLGVLVGRNSAPVQFDVDSLEKLINLQDSVLKKEKQDIEVAAAPETVNEQVDIIDTLKDKDQQPELYKQFIPPVLTPKYSKTPPPKEQPEPTEAKLEPTEAMPEPETEKQLIHADPITQSEPVIKKEPVAEVETKLKEAPKQKSPDSGYAIQVASLKNQQKAKSLMNKFNEKGYPAFCQSLAINGEMWHRVRIGPYPDRSLAEKDRLRLKEAGVDSLVLPLER